MTIPFAGIQTVQPVTQPSGALAGILGAQQSQQQMQSAALANRLQQLKLQFLPEEIKQKLAQGAQGLTTSKIQQQVAKMKLQFLPLKIQQALQKAKSDIALKNAQTSAAQTQSLFTPAIKLHNQQMIQDKKNQALLKIAKFKALKNDAFAQTQAKLLGSQLKDISAEATEANDKLLPAYARLQHDLNNLFLTGAGGVVSGTTSAGQIFRNDLTQLQLNVFSKIKNIRTQKEFNKIMSAAGSPTMYKSVLQTLINRGMSDANRRIHKLNFWHNHTMKGVRDPEQIQIEWNKQFGGSNVVSSQKQAPLYHTLSKQQLIALGRKYKMRSPL